MSRFGTGTEFESNEAAMVAASLNEATGGDGTAAELAATGGCEREARTMTQGTQKIDTTAIRNAIAVVLSRAEAPMPTATVAHTAGESLMAAVPGHRIRYALEQMEAEGLVARATRVPRVSWALVVTTAAQKAEHAGVLVPVATEPPAIDLCAFCDDQSHNRDADGFCIRCGKPAADAPSPEALSFMREEAGQPIALEADEPPAVQATLGATVAKRRTGKARTPKAEPVAAPAAKPKKAPEPATNGVAPAEASAAAAALRSAGVCDRMALVLADGRGRPGSELARLVGVASKVQRAGFEQIVAAMNASGELARDGAVVILNPMGGLVDTAALLAAVAGALGTGATAGVVSVNVTGPALAALARLLGLNVRDGEKLTRGTSSKPAGFWAILSRDGDVTDDATKAVIGSWALNDGAFSATLSDGRCFTAGSRRELQAVIVEDVAVTPLPTV